MIKHSQSVTSNETDQRLCGGDSKFGSTGVLKSGNIGASVPVVVIHSIFMEVY